ncbi:MAG: amidohydrolase family protein [Myxococcales bacterium]|nr:amidohydrolase family protein [Myxococcales bacterium]
MNGFLLPKTARPRLAAAPIVLAAACAILSAASPARGGETVVIFGATMIDGLGGAPIPDTTLVLRDGRVARIRPHREDAATDEVNRIVDARGRFVMPGLVDVGFHVLDNGTCGAVPWAAEHTIRALRIALAEGVTTALSLGESLRAIDAVGATIRNNPGAPRLERTGPILAAAGGYPTGAYPALARRRPPLLIGTEAEARAAVERVSAGGALAVWIAADDRGPDLAPLAELPLAVLTAARAEAHARGLRVLVRVQHAADWAVALRAGADAVVGVSLDPLEADTIETLVRRRVWVISSLTPYEALATGRPEPSRAGSVRLGPKAWRDLTALADGFARSERIEVDGATVSRRRAARGVVEAIRNLQRLRAAGARVAIAGGGGECLVLHGAPRAEMALLARAGFTPGEILRAATHTGAAAIGMEGRIGSLEVGKRADLLILRADPTRSLDAYGTIEQVLVAGRPVPPEALGRSPRWWESAWLRAKIALAALLQRL